MNAQFKARWDDSNDNPHCHHEKTWIIDAGTVCAFAYTLMQDSEIVFTGGMTLSVAMEHPGHKDPAEVRKHDVIIELQGPCTEQNCKMR